MSPDELKQHACAHLQVIAPQIKDASFLLDACLADARKYFRDDFINMISPEAWAKITLIYHKHFLDSGQDISIAEIIVAVIRDSLTTKRMDMVTLNISQQKLELAGGRKPAILKIVKE